jgi:CBS domain-containing protein
MRVKDLMSEGVETVSASTPAADAWLLMQQKGIRHLLVTEGRRLVGVFSERDAGGPRGTSLRDDHSVADLMTKDVVTIGPLATVHRAANVMRGRSVGSLIVTNSERPIGIVTVSDLLDVLGRRGHAVKGRPPLNTRVAHRKRQVPVIW